MLVFFIFQSVIADLVTQKIDQLPQYIHRWYTGYLNNQIFYAFFESQHIPSEDPVFLWMQGGPGCSSFFGLFYEIGPFQFEPLSNRSFINTYAWNKKANLLFMELPQGVGFSEPMKQTNDSQAALDGLNGLNDFFRQFSNFSKNAFYIGGESYAGMYIPFLVDLVLKEKKINLKGLLIGNGCTLGSECTDTKQQPLYFSKYQFDFYFKRAFFSFEDKQLYDKKCQNFSSADCVQVQYKLLNKIDYTKVDIDNVLGYCYHNDPKVQQANGGHKLFRHRIKRPHKKLHFQQSVQYCNYEYGDYFMLNNQTVQGSLHAHPTRWSSCSTTLEFKEDPRGSFDFYKEFIKKDLRIWIYSGDVDSNVPITGTLEWLQELGLEESEKWRPWFVDGLQKDEPQVAGMTWEWGKKVRFASVRGAGHEVPFWKPDAGVVLFECFLGLRAI